MKLETQLRIFFEEFDTTLEPIAPDDLGRATGRRLPPARRPARSRWAVAAAAFLALLIGVGGVGLLVDLDRAERVTATATSTTPVTSAAPSTTVPDVTTVALASQTAPTVEPAPLTWRFIDGAAADVQDSPIEAVVARGHGFVAVGSQQKPRAGGGYAVDAAVWASTDGERWQRVESPSFGAGEDDPPGQRGTQWMSDVATVGDRVVAVGYEAYSAAVWVSVDGFGWERVIDEDLPLQTNGSYMNAVAAHDGGYLAVGRHESDAGVWLSADGVDWTQVMDDDLLGDSDGQVQLWDVEVFGGGFLAVGSRGWENPGSAGLFAPFVAISVDGRSWDSIPVVEAGSGEQGLAVPAETSGRNIIMLSAIAHDGRLFALGLVGAGDAILFTSEDGRSWDSVPLPDLRYPGRLATSADHLLMTVVYDGRPSVLLTTGDMTEWLVAPMDEPGDLRAVLLTGERLLLVGASYGPDGTEFRTGIWMGTWDE